MSFKTKEDYVAEYLREGILSGRFLRGARLKQAEIAEELKLSITPVREAFRILEAEGYVLNETHRGVIVAPFDASATREINDLRILLESRLVLAAMECMTPADYAGLANLQVRYERDGLSVRTGWIAPAAPPGPARLPAEPDAWRADLAALERQLRAEFRPATAEVPQPVPAPNGQEILHSAQALVEQSERRQQRELALLVGELLREVQAQRTADLVRIDRTLGYIQNGTGAEVMRQRRMLNDLAVRVTQRQ